MQSLRPTAYSRGVKQLEGQAQHRPAFIQQLHINVRKAQAGGAKRAGNSSARGGGGGVAMVLCGVLVRRPSPRSRCRGPRAGVRPFGPNHQGSQAAAAHASPRPGRIPANHTRSQGRRHGILVRCGPGTCGRPGRVGAVVWPPPARRPQARGALAVAQGASGCRLGGSANQGREF